MPTARRTTSEPPLVSVGLPVFNGAAFVEEAVRSILAQRDVALELIACDNGSTDETPDILRRIAATDPRMRVVTSPVNRGAAWNYNRTVELARGTYFKWAAHDDVLAPCFLSRCIDILREDPSVSLAYPRAVDIDAEGEVLELHPPLRYAQGRRPSARGRAVLDHPTPCLEVFGVVRLGQLRRTARIGPYSSSDRTLLFELALHGRFRQVPEVLFLHRQHPARSVHIKGARTRDAWFDPDRATRFTFPRWRLVGAHLGAVRRAPITVPERIATLSTLVPWVARLMGPLGREVLAWAVHTIGGRLRPRTRRQGAGRSRHVVLR
ncbi:glycosyltransferase family A protein [Euzebya rosea]|uniref:glycosyltransferase family A protein n=1 Tax=Euzebya rosea TaxID=2052804 RepID=UPI000D3E53B4|nr:glycosyltransferase family A protein [Euzebya rosea]